MAYPNARAVQQYGNVDTETQVLSASSHQLIQMLLEGALGKIAVAKGAMQRGDLQLKGSQIGWASSIIVGLRSSLDMEAGGEIAANLSELYNYMCRRLLEANRANDVAVLDEVASLLMTVKGAWETIPADLRAASSDNAAPVASANSHFSVGV